MYVVGSCCFDNIEIWVSLEDRNRFLIHREIEGFKLLISLSTGDEG